MYSPAFFIRLLLTFSVFIFLHACDKPGDDAPDNKEYVVTEIKYDNSVKRESFEYNDAWQLTRRTETYRADRNITGSTKYDYTYNTDGLVTKAEIVISAPSHSPYVRNQEFGYNSDGRLITFRDSSKSFSKLLWTDNFEYNDKTIIQIHQEDQDSYTRTYTLDDNGNIIKAVTDYSSSYRADYIEEWLDYDDKQNLLGPSAGNFVSKNNHRRYIKTTTNVTGKFEYNILYTYKNGKYVEGFLRIPLGVSSSTEKANVTWVAKE